MQTWSRAQPAKKTGCGRWNLSLIAACVSVSELAGDEEREGGARTLVVLGHQVGRYDLEPLERGPEPAGFAPVCEHARLVL